MCWRFLFSSRFLCDDYRYSLNHYYYYYYRLLMHLLTHLNIIAIALNVEIEKKKNYVLFFEKAKNTKSPHKKSEREMLWMQLDHRWMAMREFFEFFPLFCCVCCLFAVPLFNSKKKTHATKLYGSTQRMSVCVWMFKMRIAYALKYKIRLDSVLPSRQTHTFGWTVLDIPAICIQRLLLHRQCARIGCVEHKARWERENAVQTVKLGDFLIG